MSFKFKVGDIIVPNYPINGPLRQDEKLEDVLLLVLNIDYVKSMYSLMILNTYTQYLDLIGHINQYPQGSIELHNNLYWK
jgi:hypothetical protein